jgi:hypothetical protein
MNKFFNKKIILRAIISVVAVLLLFVIWGYYRISSGKYLVMGYFDYPITTNNQTISGAEILRGLQNAVDHMNFPTNEIFPSFDRYRVDGMNLLAIKSKNGKYEYLYTEGLFCNVQHTDERFLKYNIYKYSNKDLWEFPVVYLTNYVYEKKGGILEHRMKDGFKEALIASEIPDSNNYCDYEIITENNLLKPIVFNLSINDKTEYICYFKKYKNSNLDHRFSCIVTIIKKNIFRKNNILRYTFKHHK